MEQPMAPNIGEEAPDFTLQTEEGIPITLSQLKQKKVLYFYPKDSTPGCTKEACDFRDAFSRFQNKNIAIFGLSKDSASSHQRFKTKYQLPFPLLVDHEGNVARAYGVLNTTSLLGKLGFGIERATFLIDETGIIQTIWRKVKVPGHIEQIYDAIHA